MRERNSLPYLVERTNARNMLYRVKTLESIPEHVGEDFDDDISCGSNEQESDWKVMSSTISLPKIVNNSQHRRADTPSRFDRQGIRLPRANSFLNVANMPLSSRGKGDKQRRPGDAKGTNYLICEPTAVGHAMNESNISRYAFRATLDRIPETDGEKLLNTHGKRKSNSGERTQQKSGLTENNAEADMKADEKSVEQKERVSSVAEDNTHEVKKLAKLSPVISGNKNKGTNLRSIDLYAQQKSQFELKGAPTRVAFSYKLIQNDLASREPPDKLQHPSAEDVVFPRIVMYQWEVHEKPKLIKPLRPRKSLKKLHRIPTGNTEQDYHPPCLEEDGEDNLNDNVLRPDSSAFKFPQAPPPTPKCESSKELYLLRTKSPEPNRSKLG